MLRSFRASYESARTPERYSNRTARKPLPQVPERYVFRPARVKRNDLASETSSPGTTQLYARVRVDKTPDTFKAAAASDDFTGSSVDRPHRWVIFRTACNVLRTLECPGDERERASCSVDATVTSPTSRPRLRLLNRPRNNAEKRCPFPGENVDVGPLLPGPAPEKLESGPGDSPADRCTAAGEVVAFARGRADIGEPPRRVTAGLLPLMTGGSKTGGMRSISRTIFPHIRPLAGGVPGFFSCLGVSGLRSQSRNASLLRT